MGKPDDTKCMKHWGKGKVTGILSKNSVEIDGMTAHILEI